jgi:signal transduction histidine kinase
MSTSTHAAPRPGPTGTATRPGALLDGILVVRWCVLVWLLVLLALGEGRLHVPLGAVAALVTAAWTLLLTVRRPTWTTPWLLGDLALCAALLVVAAVEPSLATVYPVAAAVTWGAVRGARGGALAGAALGAVYVAAHVVEGLTLADVDESVLDVAGDACSLVLAGAGVGLVSTLVQRSEAAVRAAESARLQATERAARLAERDVLARQVHDSVLQALALVHKRGRELAARPHVDQEEVRGLADLAASQERGLRELLLRSRDEAGDPAGAPLRERLMLAASRHPGLDVHVATVGDRPLPGHVVGEVADAVEACLANVERHAGTRNAWVLAEDTGPVLLVSVRDDGVGFVLDEPALAASGRMGLRDSITGRVRDLGGRVEVRTAPGRGTEVEMHVPLHAAPSVGHDGARGTR